MSKETEAGCGAVGAPVEPTVRPLLWIVRHRDDAPDSTGAIYRQWRDAVQHAALFERDAVSIVALGDIDAAVAAERERCARAARAAIHSIPAEHRVSAEILIHATDAAIGWPNASLSGGRRPSA